MRYVLTVSLTGLILAGCCAKDPTVKPPAVKESPLPPEQMKAARAVAEGNNRFALDLYARLGRSPGNVFFSPYSISTALAMVHAGARGETADEMAKVLHFTLPAGELHPAFASLMQHTHTRFGEAHELRVANALWHQKGLPLLEDFVKVQAEHYQAPPRELDFRTRQEEARRAINAWTAQQTGGKVTDLVPSGALTPTTLLMLTNAVHFKGNWDSKFDRSRTTPQDFLVSPDKRVKVPMMHQDGEFDFHEDDQVKLLEMPYAGLGLSMVVVLPAIRHGLAELEKDLTLEKLTGWMDRMSMTKVHTYLPRWKMTLGVELSRELAALGMPLAMSDQADLSGMTGEKGVMLSQVFHKAFVEVNEEGTEEAAATATNAKGAAAPPQEAEFRADHPFVFLIRDWETGCILFLGRVEDPSR